MHRREDEEESTTNKRRKVDDGVMSACDGINVDVAFDDDTVMSGGDDNVISLPVDVSLPATEDCKQDEGSEQDDPFAIAEEEGRLAKDPDPISSGDYDFKLSSSNVPVLKNMFACMGLLNQAPMFVENGRLFTTGMDASGICMISSNIRVKVTHLRDLKRQQFTINVALLNKLLKTFPSNGSLELYRLKDDDRLCIADIPEPSGGGQSGVRRMFLLDDQEPHLPIRKINFKHTVEILKGTFDAVLRMACDLKADTIHFSIQRSKSTCFFVLRGSGEAEFEQTFVSRSFEMDDSCSTIKILHTCDSFPLIDSEPREMLVSTSFCAKYLNDFCKTMEPCTLTLRFADDTPVMILYNFGSKDIASMNFILAPAVQTTD